MSVLSRLGWTSREVAALALGGRPLELLEAYLEPGVRLLLLGAGAETPPAVAAFLRARGYGRSRLALFAKGAGAGDPVTSVSADDWPADDGTAPGTLAIECVAGGNALLRPRLPGLPDEAFRHSGRLPSRELRALTLAALAPAPNEFLWDIGAGCGALAIEWLRCHASCRAIAIEPDDAQLKCIADNAAALGTPRLEIAAGRAPEALLGLAAPGAVLIEGGLGEPGLLERCWQALAPGGRLVAYGVTPAAERQMRDWRAGNRGRLAHVAIGDGGPAPHSVLQLAAVKP